jgi:hypothetical protein
VAVAVVVKIVQAHQEHQAVELVLVLLMPVKQPVRATRHLQALRKAIQVQSVLAMEVVAVVVPVAQDLQVWVVAAQVQVATAEQVTPGSMELYMEQVEVVDPQLGRVVSAVERLHRVLATEEAIHCQ